MLDSKHIHIHTDSVKHEIYMVQGRIFPQTESEFHQYFQKNQKKKKHKKIKSMATHGVLYVNCCILWILCLSSIVYRLNSKNDKKKTKKKKAKQLYQPPYETI